MKTINLDGRAIRKPARLDHKRGLAAGKLMPKGTDTRRAAGDQAAVSDVDPVNTRETATPAAAPILRNEPKWTELSDKKFIRACQLAQIYVEDSTESATSKRPRLPLPLLRAMKDAGISFDRALTMLAISPTHLRVACARAKMELGGDIVSSSAGSTSPTPLPSAKEPHMATIQAALAPSETTEQLSAPTKNGKCRLRGEALGARIRAIAHEIEVKEGVQPSYKRIHRDHGYAIETIKKYLPKKNAIAPAPVDEHPSNIDQPTPREASPEMIQMVSEIVFGADLVPGTFVGNDGVVRCDDFTKLAGGLAPLVQKWRQHEGEVARILSTARELTVA